MKMRIPHIVPLSLEVLVQLKRLQALTGHQRYLFPSLQSEEEVMSNNTLGKALRIMGYPQRHDDGAWISYGGLYETE